MAIQPQKRSKILAIGDSCIDVYAFGDCQRLSPEAPVPIFKESFRESRPGMVLNVAQNLANLDNDVEIITNSVKATKTRLVDKRFMHHLLRLDEEPNSDVFCRDLLAPVSLSEFDAVIISDYDKGFLTPVVLSSLCHEFFELKIPVFVDSKKRDLGCFENTVIKINRFENSLVTHFPKCYNLIVTHGHDGAEFKGKMYPAYDIEKRMISDYRDVSGAGDTFLAGLVHEYILSNGNMKKAIDFANKCASIAVSQFGTYVIKPNDLKRLRILDEC